MPLNPLLNRLDIIFAVTEIIPDVLRLATGDEVRLWWSTRFALDAPTTVLDAGAEVIGAAVRFGVFEVKVLGCGGRLVGVEPVM